MIKLEYPYLVVSDVHFHNWDFGSYTTTESVNSRLQQTIDAFEEAANKLEEKGGKHIVITGDLFHTRGEIKPSVYNPVYDMFKRLSERGFFVHAIPGNHDLETDETTEEGNCFKSFASIPGWSIHYSPSMVVTADELFVFIPWTNNFNNSLKHIETSAKRVFDRHVTIFAHVGLSGVVSGVAHAINPGEFRNIEGIKNVFSGHFHNHKHFNVLSSTGEYNVYSVGALTHQSFKDVDSLAGFLIVTDKDTVTHYETSAPKFVDYNNDDWYSVDLTKFQGNFTRIQTGVPLTEAEIAAVKVTLETAGTLKIINRNAIEEDAGKGAIASPVKYVFGLTKTDKLSKQFTDYVHARYEKVMAERMIKIFEKDGIDET